MDGERLAARMADIDAMEARVNGAPDKEEAIIEEMVRLLDERDEARAEVRRLTAALAVVRGDLGDTNALADGHIARLRAEHAAALATARCEGAEEMRSNILDVVPYITEHDKAIIAALPLDGDGGAS